MRLLSIHLSSTTHINDSPDTPSTSYTSGICSSIYLNQSFHSSHLWLVDSCASHHICYHPHVSVSLNPIQHSTVTLPNHATILVLYSGDVILSLDLILKDVLYAPQFHLNLISVSSLSNATNLMLHLFPSSFAIQETHTQRMIGKGNTLEGLYVLDIKTFSSVDHVNLVSIQTWHNRLSHLSSKCFHKLQKQLGCPDSKFSIISPCYICHLAK